MATSRIEFFLALAPRPAARPRSVCRGKFATVYMEPAYREWMEKAKLLLEPLRPFKITRPHTGDVRIDVTAVVEKPKKTVKVRPKGDTDNFLKGIYDAITHVKGFWEDDDQVIGPVTEAPWKRWSTGSEDPPGYHIRIEFLDT